MFVEVGEHDLDLVETIALLHAVEHALHARLESELEQPAATLGDGPHVLAARVDLFELHFGMPVERQLLTRDLAREVAPAYGRRQRVEEVDVRTPWFRTISRMSA